MEVRITSGLCIFIIISLYCSWHFKNELKAGIKFEGACKQIETK